MRLAPKVLLAIGSAAVTLLVLEVGARLLDLRSGVFLSPARDNCLQRSPALVMRMRPNCQTASVIRERGAGSDRETSHARINALGLRGDEVRDDGSTRILAIGDSCTWGWNVEQAESYPAILQSLLDQRFGPGRYEILNAGTPGFTSYQGLTYLRDEGLALHPAIVIAGYGFNDSMHFGDIESRLASDARWMPLLRVDDVLLDRSRFYRWVRWQARTPLDKSTRSPQVPLDKYGRNMTALVELARAQGAHVMLLRFAQRGWVQSPYRDLLAKVADEQGVPLVTYDGPRIDRIHPTADGYRALAEQIADRLQAEGWVK